MILTTANNSRICDENKKSLLGLILIGASIMSVTANAAQSEIDRISINSELENTANVVELSVQIDASLDEAWQLLAEDFDKSEVFVNNAISTFYIGKPKNKVGATRRTLLGNDKFMDVEITEFDAEANYIEWEIVATNVAPLKFGYSSFRLEPTSDNKVIITQRAGFKLKNAVMDFVGKLRFHKLFIDDLASVKYVLETHDSKSSITKKQRKKQYYPAVSVRKYY